jgi:acyl-CoA synthetase (AMP-forming)/AMP-acid ligase II/acyl carrier protein
MGEPLTDVFVRRWRTAFPHASEITNLYGPTETTLVKCFYRVPEEISVGVQPLGRPIPNTQVLILNRHEQLCGLEEPGEIVLRTPFRTLGYINAPEENRRRFVKNPFRDDPEDLIYFTGDAGFYRSDGTVQILGRLDDEIKIRGVRIDPAEVTATLAKHPLVRACAVLGTKDEHDESFLTAYVVAAQVEESTPAQLRSYLLEQLPAAMVPAFFVFVDGLPLTDNGKIDRKALPDPATRVSEQKSVTPRTGIEKTLARIWSEVLKIAEVGIYDNFFELGGHSLLATQIVSRICEALQVNLALRGFFEMPTIAGLCEYLETIQRTNKGHQMSGTGESAETEEITL